MSSVSDNIPRSWFVEFEGQANNESNGIQDLAESGLVNTSIQPSIDMTKLKAEAELKINAEDDTVSHSNSGLQR